MLLSWCTVAGVFVHTYTAKAQQAYIRMYCEVSETVTQSLDHIRAWLLQELTPPSSVQ